MKNILKIYMSAVMIAGLLLFTACEQDAIEPLTGKYPVPGNYTLATLLSQDAVKSATTRIFTLELGSSSQHLSVEFAGNRLNHLLPAGNYTIADQSVAKAGNYIAGHDNGGTYWVNGNSRLKLTDGTIVVQVTGDTYTISGTVMLEDRSIIKIAYTGIITFEPDPVPLTYTLETETPAIGGGMAPAPIAGSRMNKITVLADGVQVAYFEVVTADNATSLAGSYVVTDGINATGQANNGFQAPTAWGGTSGGCYYINESEKMFIRAGGGDIVITDNNGKLAITGSNLPILDVAAVEASGGQSWTNLPTPGSVDYQDVAHVITLPNVFSAAATDLATTTGGARTGYTVTLKIGEDGLTATPNMFGGLDFSGTGKYVSIDFSRDAGTLISGTYNIVDNTTAVVGDAIAGYYLNLGSFGFNSGCMWVSVEGGVSTETFITGGTVVVAESGGGTYTITVNAATGEGNVNAVYTGPITIQ
jgi:hypothetical protein